MSYPRPLAGFTTLRYFGQVGKSEINIAPAQLDALAKALDQHRRDIGHCPTNDVGRS